ncbi:MAG: polysaccharide pyruvyl transferase family protein [Candidatus Eisenbacteria bacterium]|nr:polysaccharide pyruvyl transferase family protein [Candidatus Eisenbacteria bacterium]
MLAALAHAIEDVLVPLVPVDRPVALLDFPQVPNVGDSVIWLGARAFLARRGIRPCYTCSHRSYSPAGLARRIGDGTILLSGGGNFGDLYPPHQELREAVVGEFPRNRIIQLPQTMHFESHEALERARRVFDRHSDVKLLLRDAPSLALARERFQARSFLCPDMAFALGPQPRPIAPSHPVVWLARTDKEAPATPRVDPPPGVLRVDWLRDDDTGMLKSNEWLGRLLRRMPGLHGLLQKPLSWTYGPLARERMDRGGRILSAGRVVVTNRLHAHILCLLLGIPHVVLDNSYGKVRGFHEAWTHASPLVEWSESETDALERALARAGAAGG